MNLKNQGRFILNHKVLHFFLAILLLSTVSCERDESATPKPTTDKLEKYLQFLEESGFHREHITYDATTEEFTVEKDMILSKTQIDEYLAEGPSASGKIKQRRYTYIVNGSRVTNIKYYVDGTVPTDWRTAISQAITQWNNVNGTALFISLVNTSSGADVRVNAITENGASWIARATLPSSGGAPGSIMTINTYYNTLDAGRKLFAMAHEMGHNFGLLHTNQTDGAVIPGTPVTDANSVMNSYVLPWNGFTQYDQVAVQVLYPNSGGGSVTLRQHCDYSGWTANFGIGSYNLAALQAAGAVNNDASSIRVPAGLRVTFYENDNLTGATLVRTADDNCFVNEGWNDRVSSLRVEAN
ncbi:M57 family metalloprotease [Pseudochryseolinea flava]|uniref:Dual-action HEIGH metallo-peptidase n=1 Tax=Pseudochryseolinea flava TaxID=2059302 RepID=A0A364Y0T9_9BACT|nr:M57 family metalloprotease [Pseudochryseolinea flava]RAW00404.1 hypothetical protein DQQ10_15245 [Pseudochryseolinea flava]